MSLLLHVYIHRDLCCCLEGGGGEGCNCCFDLAYNGIFTVNSTKFIINPFCELLNTCNLYGQIQMGDSDSNLTVLRCVLEQDPLILAWYRFCHNIAGKLLTGT